MNTITGHDARDIAVRYLAGLYGPSRVEVTVTSVRELDIGWLVIYQSQAYVETRDEQQALIGNAPLIVGRDGRVHTTGTSLPTSKYVDELRRTLERESTS